jgi:hypothetical protein
VFGFFRMGPRCKMTAIVHGRQFPWSKPAPLVRRFGYT